MQFPDRISGLIGKLEAGQPVTAEDVRRVGQLQALDLLKIGEDFARDAMDRNHARLDALQAVEEAKRVQLA